MLRDIITLKSGVKTEKSIGIIVPTVMINRMLPPTILAIRVILVRFVVINATMFTD